MKRMKATMSLKQLRVDPREYIRLLNNGYEVDITEHRKVLATSVQPVVAMKQNKTNISEILKLIDSLPPIQVLDPKLDTVRAIKKAKTQYMERKYGGKR